MLIPFHVLFRFVSIITTLLCVTQALEWECRYFFNEEFGYKTCLVGNVSLEDQANELVFSGTQKEKEWVELVQIRQSNAIVVPNRIFTSFTNMIILEIMNVGLKTVDRHSFRNANTLKRFWARDNDVEIIPNYTFLEAPNMTHIGLQNNSITVVEPHAFAGLEHLKVLKLEFNKIRTLSDEVFWPLTHLDHLHLRNNQLERISEKLLKKNHLLNFINFQNNKIAYIHNHAFDESIKLNHLILLNNVCIDKDLTDVRAGQLRRLKIELHRCFRLH